MLGIMPSVLFSPKDVQLITGSPAERRRFLNIHLAQSDPLYVYHLLRYSKALKQRNAFFKQKTLEGIECFEEEMAQSSLYLIQKRNLAIMQLQESIAKAASLLSNQTDNFSLKYEPSLSGKSIGDYSEQFRKLRKKEHLCKTSLVGTSP